MNLLKMKSLVALALLGSFSANAIAPIGILSDSSDPVPAGQVGLVGHGTKGDGANVVKFDVTLFNPGKLSDGIVGAGREQVHYSAHDLCVIPVIENVDGNNVYILNLVRSAVKSAYPDGNAADLYDVIPDSGATITLEFTIGNKTIKVTCEIPRLQNMAQAIVIRDMGDGNYKGFVAKAPVGTQNFGAFYSVDGLAETAVNVLAATAALKEQVKASELINDVKAIVANHPKLLVAVNGTAHAAVAYANLRDAAAAAAGGAAAYDETAAALKTTLGVLGYADASNYYVSLINTWFKLDPAAARAAAGVAAPAPGAAPADAAAVAAAAVVQVPAGPFAQGTIQAWIDLIQDAFAAIQAADAAVPAAPANAAAPAPAAPGVLAAVVPAAVTLHRAYLAKVFNPYITSAAFFGTKDFASWEEMLYTLLDTTERGVVSNTLVRDLYVKTNANGTNGFRNKLLGDMPDVVPAKFASGPNSRADILRGLEALGANFGTLPSQAVRAVAARGGAVAPGVVASDTCDVQFNLSQMFSTSPAVAPAIPCAPGLISGYTLRPDGAFERLPATAPVAAGAAPVAAGAPAAPRALAYQYTPTSRFNLRDPDPARQIKSLDVLYGQTNVNLTDFPLETFIPGGLANISGNITVNTQGHVNINGVNKPFDLRANLYNTMNTLGQMTEFKVQKPMPDAIKNLKPEARKALNNALNDTVSQVFIRPDGTAGTAVVSRTVENKNGDVLINTVTTVGTEQGNIAVFTLTNADVKTVKVYLVNGPIDVTKLPDGKITAVTPVNAAAVPTIELFTSDDVNIVSELSGTAALSPELLKFYRLREEAVNVNPDLTPEQREAQLKQIKADLEERKKLGDADEKLLQAYRDLNSSDEAVKAKAKDFIAQKSGFNAPYFAGVFVKLPTEDQLKAILAADKAGAETLRQADTALDAPVYVAQKAESFWKSVEALQALFTVKQTNPTNEGPATPETGKTAPATPAKGATDPVTPATGATDSATPATGATGKTPPATPATGKTVPANPSTDDKENDNDDEMDAPTDGRDTPKNVKDTSKGTDSTNTKKPVNTKESGNLKGLVALTAEEISAINKYFGKDMKATQVRGDKIVALRNAQNQLVYRDSRANYEKIFGSRAAKA